MNKNSIKRYIAITCVFIAICLAYMPLFSQEKGISLNVENTKLEKVLKTLNATTNYKFFYAQETIDNAPLVSLNFNNATLYAVLDVLQTQTKLFFHVKGKTISVSKDFRPAALQTNNNTPQKRITGKISDLNGEPVIGATVVVEGTNNGTITDYNGNFTLENVPDNSVITISYIGYKTLQLSSNTQLSNIVLIEDTQTLNELVVVGYGVQKKKLITGATSQLKGDDIQKLNTVSAADALKSNASGVQIVKTSGQPGSGYRINIRGVGTTGNSTPLFIVDGVQVGSLDFLNPSDIESIDILKDAASAAIYGSRAANGVILVSTKNGNYESKPTLKYDFYYGAQNLYKTVNALNAKEYALIMNEAAINSGGSVFDYASLVPYWDEIESGAFEGTNWLEETTVKNAPIQNHALSVNGGSKNSTYAMGLSYTEQEGIIGKPVAPYFQRYTGRFNSEHVVLAKGDHDIFKIGGSLVYTHTQNRGIAIGNMYGNSIRNMLKTNPFLKLYDDKGEYHYAIDWRPSEANPIGLMFYSSGNQQSKNNELMSNVFLNISPIKNLNIRTSFGYTHSDGSYRSYGPKFKLSSINVRQNAGVNQSMWAGYGVMFENTANYVLNIDKHNIDLLVGNTIQSSGIGSSLSGSNINPIFDDFKHAYLVNTPLIDPISTSLSGSPYTEDKLLSYFSRLNYNFNEKYLLTLVMRGDGSSRFAKDNRWGYFPSVAIGWVLSEEDFMKNFTTSNYLKLRFSWGQNGNQSISPFQYLSTIGYSNNSNYVDYFGIDKTLKLIGAYPDILPNKDVTWETSEQINFGIDAKFLNNKLDVVFDIYNKMTKDWLVNAPALASYGTNPPYINGGDVTNKGIEFSVMWRDRIGDFHYSVGGNLSYNKNKVTKIANPEGIIHGLTNVLGQGMDELFRAEVGYPIGYFWGYKTDGIFQNEEEINAYKNSKGELIMPNAKAGDVKFIDMNDDNLINYEDKVMIGDPNPDYIFSLNLGAEYKGAYFSMTGNGVAGNQIARSYRSPDSPWNNYTTEVFNRWHGPGTSNTMPRVTLSTHPNTQYVSDLYIEDGSYFRIQNLTLGYDFSNFLGKKLIQSLKIYTSINNLYTFTKYKGMDPEVGYNGGMGFGSGIDLGFYPIPRTVMIGTSITF